MSTESLFGDTFVFYDTKFLKTNKHKQKSLEIEIKPSTPSQLFDLFQENSKIPEIEKFLLPKISIQLKKINKYYIKFCLYK